MKIKGKNSLSNVIKICLQILLISGCVIYIILPILLKKYIEYINPSLEYYSALILLYVSGIPAIIAVSKLIKLFRTIKEGNPFIIDNVNSLKSISICSLIIATEYAIGFFFVTNSIFGIIIIAGFIMAWLGSYVLAELLKEAVEYKQENELTI